MNRLLHIVGSVAVVFGTGSGDNDVRSTMNPSWNLLFSSGKRGCSLCVCAKMVTQTKNLHTIRIDIPQSSSRLKFVVVAGAACGLHSSILFPYVFFSPHFVDGAVSWLYRYCVPYAFARMHANLVSHMEAYWLLNFHITFCSHFFFCFLLFPFRTWTGTACTLVLAKRLN